MFRKVLFPTFSFLFFLLVASATPTPAWSWIWVDNAYCHDGVGQCANAQYWQCIGGGGVGDTCSGDRFCGHLSICPE